MPSPRTEGSIIATQHRDEFSPESVLPADPSLDRQFAAVQRKLDVSLRHELGHTQALETIVGESESSWPTIGEYDVRGWLGRGAMGQVYEAWDRRLQRPVALKLLLGGGESAETNPLVTRDLDQTLPATSRGAATGIAEARRLARLSHRHIVEIYDVGTYHGRIYLATELIDGQDLAKWLSAGPRPVALVLDVFRQVASGLHAVHRLGLVHRDLKPSNILIDRTGVARITDFGLASEEATLSRSSREGTPRAHDDAALRGQAPASTAVGTPAYMAPEQWNGHPADWRSDHYAVCLCLYEGLYGPRQVPSHRPAPPFARRGHAGTTIPAGVRDCLARGLSPYPNARFDNPAQLVETLARQSARASQRPSRWRKYGVATIIGTVAATLAMFNAARPVASIETGAHELGGPPLWLQSRVIELTTPPTEATVQQSIAPGLRLRLSDEQWADWLGVVARSGCHNPQWQSATWEKLLQTWTTELRCRGRPLLLQLATKDTPPHRITHVSLLSRPRDDEMDTVRRRLTELVNHGLDGRTHMFDTDPDDKPYSTLFYIRLGADLDALRESSGACTVGDLIQTADDFFYEFHLSCERGQWRGRVAFGFGDPSRARDRDCPPLRDLYMQPTWSQGPSNQTRRSWVPYGRTDGVKP